MGIPEKTSITLRNAPDIRLGAVRTTEGWQFGIFSDDTTLVLTIFDRNEPESIISFDIPESYKRGKVFSFLLAMGETAAGQLEGLCYCVGKDKRPDAFAGEYCYAAGDGMNVKSETDYFSMSRNLLCSILRSYSSEECGAVKGPGKLNDNLLIYKLHVRSFTRLAGFEEDADTEKGASSGAVGRGLSGTFAGLEKKASYISELGMNSVLLMPCYEFHEVAAESVDRKNQYRTGYVNKVNYWGYTDGYYFAPKRAYCAGENCVREFADMVNEFHQKGIAVFMEMWFSQDMSPSMAVEILRHWHMVYGVDGFRVMGSGGLMYAARTDVLLADCVLLGEDFGGESYHVGAVSEIYDDRRRLVKYDDGFMEAGRHFLRGDEDSIGDFLGRTIRHDMGHPTVNFMADQNSLSLMDMVSYERRHNEHNGENNTDGRRFNISFNCGAEGKTKSEAVNRLRMKMVKNALAMVFLSASVPMLVAGDEFGMSHGGNNNPYCHDNEINYIDWSLLDRNRELYEFTRKLIKLRSRHKCIRPEQDFSMSDHRIKGMPDLSCHSERAWFPLMAEYSHNIGLLYCGAYAEEKGNVYILYNMHTEPHDFAVIEMAGRKWSCVLSSDEAGVIYEEGGKKIRLAERTMAVFVSGEM